MIILYNIGIALYGLGIWIASHFNEKAKLWVNGRKNILSRIKNEIESSTFNDTINTPLKKTVWIHVASLGEFEQGRPLIEFLKNKTSDYKIVLTFFSPSGYEIRKNYPLADHIFYLPIDTAKNARHFINTIQPDLAIFVKYEFWFHYLAELKKQNTTTLLISGIFNEKQFKASNPYSYLLKKMLTCFTHLFVQNTPSVLCLQKQGFRNVTMAGDTRIDRVMSIAAESQTFKAIELFVSNAPVFIAGSTWQADEEIILQLFKNPLFKNYKFIFAPHDIARHNIERLQKLFPEKSILYSEFSENVSNIITADDIKNEPINQDSRIMIIDNIGMLSSIYRYGKIAYIGGGFGRGIHNTLEPIAFGLPVIFGPNYKKFEEAIRLIESSGGFTINNYNDFEKVMSFLNIENNYTQAAQAAHDYVNKNRGATQTIFNFISKT